MCCSVERQQFSYTPSSARPLSQKKHKMPKQTLGAANKSPSTKQTNLLTKVSIFLTRHKLLTKSHTLCSACQRLCCQAAPSAECLAPEQTARYDRQHSIQPDVTHPRQNANQTALHTRSSLIEGDEYNCLVLLSKKQVLV